MMIRLEMFGNEINNSSRILVEKGLTVSQTLSR